MTQSTRQLPRRRADGELVEHGERSLLLVPGQDIAHVLNPTARALWDLCDGRTSPQEIAGAVCEVFDVDPHDAARDVAAALERLEAAGLLEPEPGQG